MNKSRLTIIIIFLTVVFILFGLGIVQARGQGTFEAVLGTAVSDDFNTCTLANQWAFIDPVGDSSMTLNGTQLLITVPAGENHDLWEGANTAPRLMQTIDDTDFEVEAKFDTSVNFRFQNQGIIVQQDDNNLIRFDFYHNGTDAFVFYAKFEDGEVTEAVNTEINNGAPMMMRIRREGDVFSQDYKIGNGAWTNHVGITYTELTVSQVGVFAGNVGTTAPAPAFTAAIDYFFNTASPISPEDPDTNTIILNKVGQGTVGVLPAKASYACGEEVIIGALPDDGWIFTGWSGDSTERLMGYKLIVTGDHTATATFIEAIEFRYAPFVSGE